MKNIFDPESVAVIGATDREGSTGKTIMENLLLSKTISVYPVNPNRQAVFNMPSFAAISQINDKIDLVIIVTPAATVPDLLEECGKKNIPAAIIISAGFKETGEEGRILEERISAIQKKYHIRVAGPNCLGVIRPHSNFNASFLKTPLEKGNIALISQSGALGSAILNWAIDSHVGFSAFVSVGSMIDIDFGDLIDFLGQDSHTSSIMIYMEAVGNARKFMSAARGFARSKPIIIIKPGKYNESARAASSHTGSLAGDDVVYDAAFSRAGAIRVAQISDMFNVSEVLHSKILPTGPKLSIVTNAGGPGVMAVDKVIELGGKLSVLSAETLGSLNGVLPLFWSHSNPVDILGDASVDRFIDSLRILVKDREVNGIIVIYTPQGSADPVVLSQQICDFAKTIHIPLITVWMGGNSLSTAREICMKNSIPAYSTPEEAVATYMYMYNYSRNIRQLYETPAELPLDQAPPRHHLKALIHRAMNQGRTLLSEEESKSFLRVYDIPVVETHIVKTPDEALKHAASIGFPVVMKISSPNIIHKSDVRGVITGINSEVELKNSWDLLFHNVNSFHPDLQIEAVVIEKMITDIDYEVILGLKRDNDFGDVILFGTGGILAEFIKDFAIGLPPLNQTLARRLIEQTKAMQLLKGFRGRPPVDFENLERIIVSFSNLVVDFPEILEIDINPLAISNGKITALDARIILDSQCYTTSSPYPHLVITPYPVRYNIDWKMSDGVDVLLRPIRPEDEPLEFEMLSTLSEEALRYRFFQIIKNISHEMLIRFCNIDYDREMAFVGELKENGKRKIIGIGRLIMDTDFKKGEFAVVVHDNYQRRGLGYKLVDMLIGVAQERNLELIYGYILSDNKGMLKICERFGFTIDPREDRTTYTELVLN
jgi:acetyltransferase